MQDGDQEHGDRLGEVEQQLGARVGEDLGRLAEVALDDGGVGIGGVLLALPYLMDDPGVRSVLTFR